MCHNFRMMNGLVLVWHLKPKDMIVQYGMNGAKMILGIKKANVKESGGAFLAPLILYLVEQSLKWQKTMAGFPSHK